MAQLPGNLFDEELKGTFPSISATFQHLYEVDQVWLKRIDPSYTLITAPLEKIESYTNAFNQLHEVILQFVAEKYEKSEVISYKNSKGEYFSNHIDEIIQHISNHGTYHRGNIATMIRLFGYKAISTDYIQFLRLKV